MKLYKLRSFRQLDHLLDILVMRRLYCAPPPTLDDPFEGVYMSALYPQTRTMLHAAENQGTPYPQDVSVTKSPRSVWEPGQPGELYRVCSLSASMKDIRLWSAYADGHRGIAIEVDIAEDSLRRVKYVTSLAEHAVHVFDPRPQAEKVLTTKTYHWTHEEEYRLLQAEPYFDLGDSSIRVFLGTRIDTAHHNLLRKLNLPAVEIVPTLLDSTTLEVCSARWSDQNP